MNLEINIGVRVPIAAGQNESQVVWHPIGGRKIGSMKFFTSLFSEKEEICFLGAFPDATAQYK